MSDFLRKVLKKKIRMVSATILLSALRVSRKTTG